MIIIKQPKKTAQTYENKYYDFFTRINVKSQRT